MTKIFGLVGYPLGHSFSAKYFSDKFEKEGIDAKYLNFEMQDILEIERILSDHKNLVGFNITIPHKTNIFPYLSEIDQEAKAIGAVNVVKTIQTDKGIQLKGFNSDVIGFEKSLKPQLQPSHKKALIFGTGGASKAVVYALQKLGISYKFVSRTPSSQQFTYADITPEVMEEYTLLINCTPLGMSPKTELCPEIPYKFITSNHYLYDLIYNPEETLFLKNGAKQGAVTKNGLEMLHLQAEAAWEIWNRP